MSDRKVAVNEDDLRRMLNDSGVLDAVEARGRLRAALDALGPEPCGHPSEWTTSSGIQG